MHRYLTENFRFEFEGQNAVDLTGLTRIVFDKILPTYCKIFLHLCTFKTPTFTCATNNSLIFLFYLTFS